MQSGAALILTPFPNCPSVWQEKLFSAGARYREALWVLEVSLGDDHPLLASTLIDIAEVKAKSLLQLPGGRAVSWPCGKGAALFTTSLLILKTWYVRFAGDVLTAANRESRRIEVVFFLSSKYQYMEKSFCRSTGPRATDEELSLASLTYLPPSPVVVLCRVLRCHLIPYVGSCCQLSCSIRISNRRCGCLITVERCAREPCRSTTTNSG